MEIKQINVKLPENLRISAERYAKNFGFRNIQELMAESLREKIFEKNEYDENFDREEIEMIDRLIGTSIKKGDVIEEEELNSVLLS
tara:strand:+ start:2202 stop:2459 length:258 start_codon:yes stop_codon:yes gene_type:complete